jgi:hypothetical protein
MPFKETCPVEERLERDLPKVNSPAASKIGDISAYQKCVRDRASL